MTLKIDNFVKYSMCLFILIFMYETSTDSSLVKGARVILFSSLVLYVLAKTNMKISFSYYHVWIVMFLLYNILMINFAFSKTYAKQYLFTVIYILIINFLLIYFLRDHLELIQTFLLMMILGSLIKSVYTYATNGLLCFVNNRHSTAGSANTIGLYAAFAIVFCVYFYTQNIHSQRKYIYFVLGVVNAFSLVLTASRKAIIFMLVPLFIFYIFSSKNLYKSFLRIIMVGIVSILLILILVKIPFFYNLVGNRLLGMVNAFLGEGGDGSTENRLNLIQFGIDRFKENKLWGYGLSNFRVLYKTYYPHRTEYYAHNNYIELLVDCGIVGTAIYYSLYMNIFIKSVRTLRSRNSLALIFMGMLISILICEYGIVTYYSIYIQTLLALFFVFFSFSKEFTINATNNNS